MVSTAFAADDDNIIPNAKFTLTKDTATIGGTSMSAKFQVSASAHVGAFIVNKAVQPEVAVKTLDVNAGGVCVASLCPANSDVTVTWDGKKNDGTNATDGDYTLRLVASVDLGGGNTNSDTDELTVHVATALTITSFSVSPTTWDPAAGVLTVNYSLSKAANVVVNFLDGTTAIRTVDDGLKSSGSLTWDGKVSDNLVVAKTYSVKLSASVSGESKDDTKTFTVVYNNELAPHLSSVSTTPLAFTAGDDKTTVSFTLDHDAYVTVNILDKDLKAVYNPTGFDGSKEYSLGINSFEWDGTKNNGDVVNTGKYTIEITARNANGVAYNNSLAVDVTSTGSKYLDGSAKIKNISLDPTATSTSNAWDPIEDKLDIDWELMDDFDSMKIEARKGDTVVEVYDENDVDSDTYDTSFEGKDDDDEYLDTGAWKLVFKGEIEDNTYYVEKTFYVKYAKPEIDDTFVTKKTIDPELDEGVYFGFQLKDGASVDVEVLKNSASKVTLMEDEELTKNKWYAVYWDGKDEDGDNFDYDDTMKIRITAKSLGDDDVYNTLTEAIDLDEDDVSSSKSNVTLDTVLPPILEQGETVTLTFNMEDDAKLRVGIWEGTSTSGSPDIELLPSTAKKAGDFKFTWNGKNKSGSLMKKGYYSYKITAEKTGSSSDETESGQFVIGDVEDIFGGPAEGDEEVLLPEVTVGCGFKDVLSTNVNCSAIEWAKSNDVFEGDPDGNFRPFDTINRAEVLAVVLRAFILPVYNADGTNLGWTDVDVKGWYMSFLRSAKILGLLEGDAGKTTVRPNDKVSRVEFLKFAYKSKKTPVTACSINPYGDVLLGEWYTNYACQAKKDGLFDVLAGYFLPGEAVTRGKVAEALYRLLGK